MLERESAENVTAPFAVIEKKVKVKKKGKCG
jgi:hypothetical protein